MGNTTFDRLPREIHLEIGSYLTAFNLAALVRTCRSFNFVQDILYDIAVTYTLSPTKEWNEEQTVLQWAVFKSRQRKCLLAALLRKGADIHVAGILGTLLHDVAARGDEEATKLLIRSGIHPWTIAYNVPPLVHASGGGHEPIVRYLLYIALNEWPQNAPQRATTHEKLEQLTEPWKHASLPWILQEALHRAAKGGHVEIVKLLCQHVDVSVPSINGNTFTSSAAKGGSIEIMESLLELGAELDSFALGIAARHGHLALVTNIISRRPMDVFGDTDRTPLHDAAENGHADIVKILLHHGADHEARSSHGSTALRLATYCNHADVISILADLPITAPSPTYEDPYGYPWC
ncbi:ankyrin repeat-containing domain protein [Leptodontidium sp. MPI-SDFR-AT-0119]|nr:ankyrin repeat-containing domain protein [Leptodontidium sp. MPI-SDFR-AT-0119]